MSGTQARAHSWSMNTGYAVPTFPTAYQPSQNFESGRAWIPVSAGKTATLTSKYDRASTSPKSRFPSRHNVTHSTSLAASFRNLRLRGGVRNPGTHTRVHRGCAQFRRVPGSHVLNKAQIHPVAVINSEVSGCSAVWLAHRSGGPEVTGSNPVIPTIFLNLKTVSNPEIGLAVFSFDSNFDSSWAKNERHSRSIDARHRS